jgi:hypothetical protein
MCAVILAASVPAVRARRPYVPELGQWMSREERRLPAGLFDDFHQALNAGSLAGFARRMKADSAALAKAALAKNYSSCVIEYVRHPRTSPVEFPVYITFINNAASPFEVFKRGRNSLRQVLLAKSEVVALRSLFPRLDDILTGFQVDSGKSAVTGPEPAHPLPERARGREAVIREVEGGGTLRTGAFLLIINLLGLVPLVTFFGGLALIVAGGWGFFHGWETAATVTCVAVGILSFLEGSIQAKYFSGLLETWYSRRRLMNTLVLRPDPIVAVNGPDAEMVNLTRRENWIKVQLDVRDDIGLLEIDDKRRELRIEGDKRRYQVPIDAVISCQPECFYHPIDKQLTSQYWYVRLVVPVDGREQELLFAPSFADWRPRTNANRQILAANLARRINAA